MEEMNDPLDLLVEYHYASGMPGSWDIVHGRLELRAFWLEDLKAAILPHAAALVRRLVPRDVPDCPTGAHCWTWLRERVTWRCETCGLEWDYNSTVNSVRHCEAVALENTILRPVFGESKQQRRVG